jgi:replicative DNA helicase
MTEQAEDAVVGMALYQPDLIPKIQDRLPSTAYLKSSRNQTILRTVYEIHDDGQDVTPVTVAEELEGEKLKEIGGASYLAQLANNYSVLDTEGFESCVDDVVSNHIEREAYKKLIRGGERIDDGEDAQGVIQDVTASLDNLQAKNTTSDITQVANDADSFLDMIDEADENGALPGTLSTGFPKLDDRIKGISKNDLILISADTGIGKTSLALQIADTVADGQGGNALIFSGEMHGWEIIMKLLSKRGVATLDEMQDGELSEDQKDKIEQEIDDLKNTGLYTIRESQPTIYDFKGAVRRADSEHGIDLAVLDYVQMLRNPSPEAMDSVEHLNLVSSELRDFTNDIEVPVLAISRQNKGGEIYGSSQLKYDCNYRIVIEGPGDGSSERMLKVEKARLAKGGKLSMQFQGEYSRFITSRRS